MPDPSPHPADHIMGVYNRAPLAFERGEGSRLWSDRWQKPISTCHVAGIAVNALGHAHPKLVAALKAQGEKLWHVSNIYRIPEQEALAERLCATTFADVVFFTNSGTEAVECALKAARKYHWKAGAPEADRHHRLRRLRSMAAAMRRSTPHGQRRLPARVRAAPAGLCSAAVRRLRGAQGRRWDRPPRR